MLKNFKTVGIYVVFLYCLIYYLLPIIGQYLFFDEIHSIYIRSQEYIWIFIWIPATLTLFSLIYCSLGDKLFIFSRKWGWGCYWLIKSYLNNRSLIIIFYILCAIYFSWYLDSVFSSFRYSSVGISESKEGIFSYLIVKTLVQFDMIILFVFLQFSKKPKIINTFWLNLSVVVVYFSMVGGIADLILGLMVFGLLLYPKLTRWLTFSTKKKIAFYKLFLIVLVAIFALFLVIFFGTMVKMGYSYSQINAVEGLKFIPDIRPFSLYLIERFSSSLHSLDYVISNSLTPNNESYILLILESFQYRLFSILNTLGFNFINERPEFSGMSQYNFSIISTINDDRQGTSPGVFASFIYLLGVPLGFLWSAVYLVWIARVLNWLFIPCLDKGKFNLAGYFSILFIFGFFFQSPIDLLNLLDNVAILNLLILVFASANKYSYLRKKSTLSRY
jgi:hypothetical protein